MHFTYFGSFSTVHFSTISTWHFGWSSCIVCCTCWVVHSVWYLVLHTVRLPLWHFLAILGDNGKVGSGRTSRTMLFSVSSSLGIRDWKTRFATSTSPSGQTRTRTFKRNCICIHSIWFNYWLLRNIWILFNDYSLIPNKYQIHWMSLYMCCFSWSKHGRLQSALSLFQPAASMNSCNTF